MMNNSANIVARANGGKGSYPESSVEAQGMQVKNDGAQKRGRGFNRGRGANRGFRDESFITSWGGGRLYSVGVGIFFFGDVLRGLKIK